MYFQPYQSLRVSFDQLLVYQDPMTKKVQAFISLINTTPGLTARKHFYCHAVIFY